LLDAKKQYVRFISHEIRTPLNAMFLGLQLLADDLENCIDPRDVKLYENLCDVQLSCNTALDTLNDLLTFEKLDSGILDLHKEELGAAEFVTDCVRMFGAQAKAKKVTLEVKELSVDQHLDRNQHLDQDQEAGGGPSHSRRAPALPLRSHDMISLDKFKIAQVIRNLISNALKFTPAGGSVTVTPSFVYNRVDSLPALGSRNLRRSGRNRRSSMDLRRLLLNASGKCK
jgi:signal transduction histidine kinase